MNKTLLFGFMFAFILGSASCDAKNKQKQRTSEKTFSENIEVYYFHYTRRCVTCNLVESETKKQLDALYPELVENGKIIFSSINLDDSASKAVVEKCGAIGQSLLVISRDKKVDLTQAGFMYARSQPEKLKNEIKSVVDSMID